MAAEVVLGEAETEEVADLEAEEAAVSVVAAAEEAFVMRVHPPKS